MAQIPQKCLNRHSFRMSLKLMTCSSGQAPAASLTLRGMTASAAPHLPLKQPLGMRRYHMTHVFAFPAEA